MPCCASYPDLPICIWKCWPHIARSPRLFLLLLFYYESSQVKGPSRRPLVKSSQGLFTAVYVCLPLFTSVYRCLRLLGTALPPTPCGFSTHRGWGWDGEHAETGVRKKFKKTCKKTPKKLKKWKSGVSVQKGILTILLEKEKVSKTLSPRPKRVWPLEKNPVKTTKKKSQGHNLAFKPKPLKTLKPPIAR